MSISVSDIRKELEKKDKEDLLLYLAKLVRFRKENKELLSFVLFEAGDIDSFIKRIKNEMDVAFSEINTSNVYFIKKSTRKILRNVTKNIRFAGSKEVEAELLIGFCNCFKKYGIPTHKSKQLMNIYTTQFQKVESALEKLHPDLQYDLKQTLLS